jgi:dolichyl-phosphate-mannose--protein O-mannosyl transferase
VSLVQAGSVPYAAMTAWSALKVTGELCFSTPKGKRVLILGGSGGVGAAAIQLLKAWGAQVSSINNILLFVNVWVISCACDVSARQINEPSLWKFYCCVVCDNSTFTLCFTYTSNVHTIPRGSSTLIYMCLSLNLEDFCSLKFLLQ